MSSSPVKDATATRRPRVVIVGAGFGGLEAAKALSKAPVEVTVLDRENHHCFQPLLYQVATASLSPADIAWPIRGVLRRRQNVTVLMAEVRSVDLAAHCVVADTVRLPYDFLILSAGATHSYFGHDEWAPYAPGLKHIEDATEIRRRLLLAFEKAELTTDETERTRLLTFVVVGGGPTGVEMAGAISDLAHGALPLDFRHFDPRKARILLVEAGPRTLPTFPEDLAAYAHRALEKMGVEVSVNTKVIGCDAEGVLTERGRISSATVIWAAGVVASGAAGWVGAPHDRAGRILVGPDLSVPDHPEIFAIGDTASVTQDGKPVPGIAPAAKQMGKYVGRLIAARVSGQPTPRPFVYHHQGDLATIGRKAAVVSFGRFKFRGFIGWLFWSVAHIYFLIGTRNRVAVAFDWAWSYVTFQRSARLITEAPPPYPPSLPR